MYSDFVRYNYEAVFRNRYTGSIERLSAYTFDSDDAIDYARESFPYPEWELLRCTRRKPTEFDD